MNFCVRCGAKEVYQEYLCQPCYAHIHPPSLHVTKKEKKSPKQVFTQESARSGGYFEAVLQLRNVAQDVVDFVLSSVEEHKAFISKKEWLDHGVDLYMSDKKVTQKMGRLLQQKFGGMVKTSAKIFTRDRLTLKDVYRVTVLFKQFPYTIGDTFDFKGKTYTILTVGTEVIAEHKPSHKKRVFLFKALEKARLF